MSDTDDINLDESESGLEDSSSQKKSGGSGFLPSLLKWIAIGLGALVFIITVVVFTVKVVVGSGSPQTMVPQSEDYKSTQEKLSWYDSLGVIRTSSSDSVPASIVVEVALGYKENDKNVSTEITARSLEIKDWLRSFFRMKTSSDLRPQNEKELKIEIKNGLNDEILQQAKIKEVLFKQLDVISQ